jgi:hypothetical protein
MSPKNFATVPDSDTEIVEEVGYHRRTKRGMKSTYKQVPATQPPQEKAGQASRSRSTKKRQAQLPEVESPQPEPDPTHMDDMQAHGFIDEQEDDLPEFVGDVMQPRTMV